MASSAASAGWGPGDRPGAGWWGHGAPNILIVAIASSIVMVLRPLPSASPAAALVPLALVAVVVVTWLQMRRHDRSLCERCMAAMPLDAPAAAHRYRRRLAIAHVAERRALLLAGVAVLLTVDLAMVTAPSAWAGYLGYAWAGAQLSLVYLVLSHTTHRRLQPWCPQCRDGGGGSGTDLPEPVPSDFSSR